MRAYISCNCISCRRVPSKIKGRHKKVAHRKLRQRTRKALFNGQPCPDVVTTGYKDLAPSVYREGHGHLPRR